jgi:hypothetical protein
MRLGKHLHDYHRFVAYAGLILPSLSPGPCDESLEALRCLLIFPDDRRVGLAGGLIPHPVACDEARDLPNHGDG